MTSSKLDAAQLKNLRRLGMDTKKHVTQDLDWRERRALDAFKEKKALCYSDLLYMMGRSTMDRLVRRGLMDTPPTRAGKYAKDFEWRLKS